jgi:hypothetical protein
MVNGGYIGFFGFGERGFSVFDKRRHGGLGFFFYPKERGMGQCV